MIPKRNPHEDNYNRIASIYDLIASPFERRFQRKGIACLAPSAGERLLEIGIGTGYVLSELAKVVSAKGEVWGIDISESMIRISKRRLKREHLNEMVHVIHGDVLKCNLPSNYFDGIYMGFTIELFSDLEIDNLLKRCTETLKPHGRICIVSLLKQGTRTPIDRMYERIHYWFPHFIDCRPISLFHILEHNGFQALAREVHSFFGMKIGIALFTKK